MSGGVAAIGVDAGGTKTVGVLVTPDGAVVARADAGPANYQDCGARAAEEALGAVVSELRAAAEGAGLRVTASAWGLAGLDRPRDLDTLDPLVGRVDPAPERARVLVNDAFLALRAGTTDGVGVAVVSGTGSNCVAVGPDRKPRRIGGLAFEFGDDGGGGDIGRDGLRAAFRGDDGRGPRTLLTQLLRERFALTRLDDLVDAFVADAEAPIGTSALAPLVFDAANLGDGPALAILEAAGRELALSARVLAAQVFAPDASFALVLGGSVLQRGRSSAMRDALVADVRRAFPAARPHVLTTAPVAGAALLALDRMFELGDARGLWPDLGAQERLAHSLRTATTEAQ
ncbi:MAG: hypothetical protein H6698_06015 [Myxococcales bacterium]|nr:hypothetical protein [Myxococcales bacterium]MCB9533861.1 hypothetical protein [Myxococcales bacterium]